MKKILISIFIITRLFGAAFDESIPFSLRPYSLAELVAQYHFFNDPLNLALFMSVDVNMSRLAASKRLATPENADYQAIFTAIIADYIPEKELFTQLDSPEVAQAEDVPQQTQSDVATRECAVCFDNCAEEQFLQMHCGHEAACRECMNHLVTDALEKKTTDNLVCTDPNCKAKLTDDDIAYITQEEFLRILELLRSVQLQEYLRTQPNTIQCPTVDCPNVFLPSENGQRERVHCDACDKHYCSDCKVEHAMQISCEAAAEQRRLAGDQNAAAQADEEWKRNNTRACPTCQAAVQKVDGCNHMTCLCGAHFCWEEGHRLSLNPYRQHGRLECGCLIFPEDHLLNNLFIQQLWN